ncbi:intradiol ring-cleavage dioxygenase [Polaromonas sp.]|uniref:dioxygenase family protein n=1 Tax=Polaromonas sp. TaxID=1869339 RepID=UPI003CAEC90F
MHPALPPSSPVFPLTLRRRTVAAALVAAPALWLGVRAQPAAGLRATPAQTEGPYYPVVFPKDSDHDLLRNGALAYPEGQSAWVEGSVSDLAGKPVAGALVEIWQCDHAGRYHHPGDGDKADRRFQGFGRVAVGADGRYRFRTLRPVAYAGRTPHIHVKVKLGQRELLTTQLYVAGDPGNTRDSLWRSLGETDRAALTVPFAPGSDGLQARFPIVVSA